MSMIAGYAFSSIVEIRKLLVAKPYPKFCYGSTVRELQGCNRNLGLFLYNHQITSISSLALNNGRMSG